MHLETSQGTLHNNENETGIDDAPPSSSESENDFLRNGLYEDSDHADNELSDNDEEFPRHVEPFMNPVYYIEHQINEEANLQNRNEPFNGGVYWNDIEHWSETTSGRSTSPHEEQSESPFSGCNQYYYGQLESRSTSEMSEYDGSDHNDAQIDTSVTPENITSEDSHAGPSNHEEIDAVEGASNNLEIDIFCNGTSSNDHTNQIYPNWINDDYSNCIFVICDDDFAESISTSITSHSSPYFAVFNSSFETPDSPVDDLFTYWPGKSGYQSSNGVRGLTQTSGYVSPGNGYDETTQSSYGNSDTPDFYNPFSPYYDALGNSGYATLQFMPYLTILDNSRHPNHHCYYNVPNNRSYPGLSSPIYNARYRQNYPSYHSIHCNAIHNLGHLDQYSTNDSNDYGYVVRYSTFYGIPNYTGYVSANFRGGPIFQSFPGIYFNTPHFVVPYYTNSIAPVNHGYTGPHAMDYDSQNCSGCPGNSKNYSNTPNNQIYTAPRFINYNNPANRGNTDQQTNNTTPINQGYTGSYSTYNRDNTSFHSTYNHSITDNYGYVAPTQLNDSVSNDNQPYDTTGYDIIQNDTPAYDIEEHDNATNDTNVNTPCDGIPQESGYGASDNHDFEVLQLTNPISPYDTGNEALNSTLHGYETPSTIPEFMSRLQTNSFYNGVLHYSSAPSTNYSATDYQNNQEVSGNVNNVQSSDEASVSLATHYYAGPGSHYYGNNAPGTYGHVYRGPIAYVDQGSISYGAQGPINHGATVYNPYRALGFNGHIASGFYGYIAPGLSYRAPGVNCSRTPTYYGTVPRLSGYMCHSGYSAIEFADNSAPKLDGNCASDFTINSIPDAIRYGTPNSTEYRASAMAGSSAPNTFNSSTQNSLTYTDQSNDDRSSPSSSDYWIGHESNLSTIFDSNGRLIDRHDMEQTMTRFFVSDERYIPAVRLQSEANNEDDSVPRSEHRSSHEQRATLPPFSTSSMTQNRSPPPPIFTKSRGSGRGRGHGRGHGDCNDS